MYIDILGIFTFQVSPRLALSTSGAALLGSPLRAEQVEVMNAATMLPPLFSTAAACYAVRHKVLGGELLGGWAEVEILFCSKDAVEPSN